MEHEPACFDLFRLLRPRPEQGRLRCQFENILEVRGLIGKLEDERPAGSKHSEELGEPPAKVILPRFGVKRTVLLRNVALQIGHAVLADRMGRVEDSEIEGSVTVWEIAEVFDFVRLDQIAAVRLTAEAGIQYLELCFLVN